MYICLTSQTLHNCRSGQWHKICPIAQQGSWSLGATGSVAMTTPAAQVRHKNSMKIRKTGKS